MKLSLCVICKNEEEKIGRCISSVKDIVNEVIIVDTGSEDKTIEIAEQLGAKVFQIPWENDFAKAKNFAIEKAKGDWIIFLDADEYFTKESIGRIRGLIKETERRKKDCILCELLNEDNGKITSSFKTNRIFKNDSRIRYKGKIHERLCKENGSMQMVDFLDQIRILHDGYSKEVIKEKNKSERNKQLLLEELKENPTSSDLYYYLMQISMGELDKAWEYGNKAILYNSFHLLGAKVAVYDLLLNICGAALKDSQLTYELYNKAVQEDKTYPDFDFRYGTYLYKKEMYKESIPYFNLCLSKAEVYEGPTLSIVRGSVIVVFELLENAYLEQKQYEQAIPVLVKILRINPYRVKELYNLINILQTKESGMDIGNILSRLYDYSKMKDQLLLLQISKAVKNQDLYDYILKYVGEDVKKQMEA